MCYPEGVINTYQVVLVSRGLRNISTMFYPVHFVLGTFPGVDNGRVLLSRCYQYMPGRYCFKRSAEYSNYDLPSIFCTGDLPRNTDWIKSLKIQMIDSNPEKYVHTRFCIQLTDSSCLGMKPAARSMTS